MIDYLYPILQWLSGLFHIYLWYLSDIARFCLFIFMIFSVSHFIFFVVFNNASFHRLFRMGESDYLYDNLMQKPFSIEIFSFYLFWKKELDGVESHATFIGRGFSIKIYLRWIVRFHGLVSLEEPLDEWRERTKYPTAKTRWTSRDTDLIPGTVASWQSFFAFCHHNPLNFSG